MPDMYKTRIEDYPATPPSKLNGSSIRSLHSSRSRLTDATGTLDAIFHRFKNYIEGEENDPAIGGHVPMAAGGYTPGELFLLAAGVDRLEQKIHELDTLINTIMGEN